MNPNDETACRRCAECKYMLALGFSRDRGGAEFETGYCTGEFAEWLERHPSPGIGLTEWALETMFRPVHGEACDMFELYETGAADGRG